MATALITGANRGLGLEWTRQLLARGETVFATCRHPASAPQLDDLADDFADQLHLLELDVTKPDTMRSALNQVEQESGALHLLVNNAGVDGGARSDAFGALSQERMLHVFNVNAAGPHLLAQEAAPLLKQTAASSDTSPKVVNISSDLGSIEQLGGQATWQSYRASKAALNMLTKLLSFELKSHGVIAIAMQPGWVQTDMGGRGAPITPRESVRGMLEVLDDLTMEETGSFLTWQGETVPW